MTDTVLWARYYMEQMREEWDKPQKVKWVEYPILKRTKRYVYVCPWPGQPQKWWYRLSIDSLVTDGKATAKQNDRSPYFTAAGKTVEVERIRVEQADRQMRKGLQALEDARILLELGDKLDFLEVAPGVFKARGFHAYVQFKTSAVCEDCPGADCSRCNGDGEYNPMALYLKANPPPRNPTFSTYSTGIAWNLDDARLEIARQGDWSQTSHMERLVCGDLNDPCNNLFNIPPADVA